MVAWWKAWYINDNTMLDSNKHIRYTSLKWSIYLIENLHWSGAKIDFFVKHQKDTYYNEIGRYAQNGDIILCSVQL